MIKSATFKEKNLNFLFRRNFDIWRCSIESSERVRKSPGRKDFQKGDFLHREMKSL